MLTSKEKKLIKRLKKVFDKIDDFDIDYVEQLETDYGTISEKLEEAEETVIDLKVKNKTLEGLIEQYKKEITKAGAAQVDAITILKNGEIDKLKQQIEEKDAQIEDMKRAITALEERSDKPLAFAYANSDAFEEWKRRAQNNHGSD